MRKASLFLICLTLLIFFSGCKNQHNPVRYSNQLSAVKKVNRMPDSLTNSIIKNELLLDGAEVPDGYLASEGNTIKKYDLKGVLIWSKKYSFIKTNANSRVSITPSGDGDFVLGLICSTYQRSDGSWDQTDPIVAKCDRNGNLLWLKAYEGFSDTALEKIFCLQNGDIITAGYTENQETKTVGVVSSGDIYLSKIDKSGNLLCEKYYNFGDFDSLYDVYLVDETYIAALINTNPATVVNLFNLNLEQLWQKDFSSNIIPDCMTVYENNIYLIDYDNILYKMDLLGNLTTIIDFQKGDSYASLINGSKKGVAIQFKNDFILLNTDGTEKLKIPLDVGRINKIIEYENGLLILSTNITGTLPQPLYINSIWQSTELVYSGYDTEGKLLWRNAFDNTPEFMKNYDPASDPLLEDISQ